MSEREILNINNTTSRWDAAYSMVERGIVMSVHQYGAMLSADSESTFWKISSQLKDRKDPMAPTFPKARWVKELVDPNRIDQTFFNHFLCNTKRFDQMFAGSCMLRFPVRENATLNGVSLHPGIVSQTDEGPVMQVFYPGKTHQPVQKLVEAMYQAGIKAPVITSLNFHGGKTPTTRQGVLDIANKAGLYPVILEPRSWFTSRNESYPILVLDRDGVHCVRPGNFSDQDLHAVGWPIEANIENKNRYQLFKRLWQIDPQICFNMLIGNRFFHQPKN